VRLNRYRLVGIISDLPEACPGAIHPEAIKIVEYRSLRKNGQDDGKYGCSYS
jgi:hypothetical protein